MKFGAHGYIFTDRWADERLHLLDEVKALGAGAFEIAVGEDVRFSPERTRQRAENLGLDLIVSPGGTWPAGLDVSSADSALRRGALDWHKKWIDLAADLRAVAYTGNLYGRTGEVLKRRPPPDELPRVAEGLRELAEYAKRKGLKVALEPMSHFRTHLINTPEQARRVLDLAGHENLFVLLDTYHMVTEVKDYAAGIRALKGKLWGLHACESDRGCPGGGLVPWAQVFSALRETGFNGYVMLESYNSSVGDFAYERAMFHNVCPDGADFVRRGLAFVKQGLGVARAP